MASKSPTSTLTADTSAAVVGSVPDGRTGGGINLNSHESKVSKTIPSNVLNYIYMSFII